MSKHNSGKSDKGGNSYPRGRGRGSGVSGSGQGALGDSYPWGRGRGRGVSGEGFFSNRESGSVNDLVSGSGSGQGGDSYPRGRGRGRGVSGSGQGALGDSYRWGRGRGRGVSGEGFFSNRESGSVSWRKNDLVSHSGSGPSSSSSSESVSASRRESEFGKVIVSDSIRKCYKKSKTRERSSSAWGERASSGGDIWEKVRSAKLKGLFAATDIIYSVLMLGSTRVSSRRDQDVEKLVEELYLNGFTRVQHGIFALINRELVVDDRSQYPQVAKELARLFNNDADLRSRVRRQWMEFKSDGLPHRGGEYLSEHLIHECEFLISEYVKHAPTLGLSVKKYLDLTSTLYDRCNPNFGDIDQTKNYAFFTPINPSSKLILDKKFTKKTLSERLLSLRHPDQQMPNKAIFNCNNTHELCILTEIRYRFVWKDENLATYRPSNLASHRPSLVDCRMDYCKYEGSDHIYSYLTQQDRFVLQNAIIRDSSYGFYEIMPEDVAQLTEDVARMNQPKDIATLNQAEDDELGKVDRKGKGKRS